MIIGGAVAISAASFLLVPSIGTELMPQTDSGDFQIQVKMPVGTALATGGETDFGEQYFRTTPRFETGDDRYSWMNTRLFLAEGRVVPGAIEYRVYRVD